VDDVRVSNPASNPELLAELGRRFTDYKYDFKKLVKDICMSRTYQLSTKPTPSNEGDTRNFARGPVRRIRAETMLDCISQVTETKTQFPGLPLGARAVQIADGANQHLLPDNLRPGNAGKRSAHARSSWSRRFRNRCTYSTAERRRPRSSKAALWPPCSRRRCRRSR